MSRFSGMDRVIGRRLERYPVLRRALKQAYLRVAYLLNARRRRIECGFPFRGFDGFFGYYDKSPWSPSGRFFAYHHEKGNCIEIRVADLAENREWVVGSSLAWNWQQGAMLRWLGEDRVIFNNIASNCLIAECVGIRDGTKERYDMPIQTLHPNGTEALCLNYRRLAKLRPEYGYAIEVENFSPELNDDSDGIWTLDLKCGKPTLSISIDDLKRLNTDPRMERAQHKVNHIMYSPSGTRYVFMHRWIGAKGKFSRLYVSGGKNGGSFRCLMDDGMISHYSWKDDDNLIVFGRVDGMGDHYFHLNVVTGETSLLGYGAFDSFGDGHPTLSPDGRWMVTDTYPDKGRMRSLFLYDFEKHQRHLIGRFFSPWKFDGPNRVDLHPRWGPDGRWISVDSAHEGVRKTYIIDVGSITKP